MLKRVIHERDYWVTVITHLIFFILGIVLLYCGRLEDEFIAYIFIFIFVCLKVFCFFIFRERKTLLKKLRIF